MRIMTRDPSRQGQIPGVPAPAAVPPAPVPTPQAAQAITDSARASAMRRSEVQTILREVAGAAIAEAREEMLRRYTELSEQVGPVLAFIRAQEARQAEEAARRATNHAEGLVDAASGAGAIATGPQRSVDPQVKDGFSAILRALGRHRGDARLAAEDLGSYRPRLAEAFKARNVQTRGGLSTLVMADGGFLVPDGPVVDFVDFLRNATLFERAGARYYPMDKGTINLGRQTATATITWGEETQKVNATKPQLGKFKLEAKKAKAVVPVSNDLIRRSDPAADAWVQEDLRRAMAVDADLRFLRGTGASSTPKGIRYQAASANVFAANGTFNLANATADLGKMVRLIEAGNVPLDGAGWAFAARVWWAIRLLRDTNGGWGFPELQIGGGSLFTYPTFKTEQIPTNLGGGTNESEIYFVAFPQVVIGTTLNMQIEALPGASYTDDTGTLVSSFDTDETPFRIIYEADVAMRYTTAASIATGCTWA